MTNDHMLLEIEALRREVAAAAVRETFAETLTYDRYQTAEEIRADAIRLVDARMARAELVGRLTVMQDAVQS